MKRDRRPSFVRILVKVFALVVRRAPLPFVLLLIVNIGLSGANVLVYHRLERLMSLLADSESPPEFHGPIVGVGTVLLILVLIDVLQDPLAVYFRQTGIRVATELVHEKVERLELIDFETVDANDRLELAKHGVEGALTMVIAFLSPALQLVFFAMAAGYLYSLSPPLALVVPLVFVPRIVMHLVRGSRYYRLERRTVPALREYQYLERCLVDREYFKETRTLGAGADLLQRYRDVIGWFNVQRWREDVHMAKIDAALNILVIGGCGSSFVLAALLLANGNIGIGGFAVVVIAISKLMVMTSVVVDTVGLSYRKSATAAHLFEFLLRDEGRVAEGADAAAGGAMEARDVTFVYPGSVGAAVDGVSLDIRSGTTVALVGTNGAGKTTLAKLLLGLYVPASGRILRGCADTRGMAGNEIRANTSAVFQNFQRYRMSLRENVILADVAHADDERRLTEALVQGGVPAELWQGKDGWDVELSRELGSRDLSLGEWQRLAIARGLFRHHDTIVLDEPTASIDPLEEQAVYERFMEVAAGRTAIIVTHRLGSARLADRILVLDHGRVVEDGTHRDLIRRRGLYHKMFMSQALWYERDS